MKSERPSSGTNSKGAVKDVMEVIRMENKKCYCPIVDREIDAMDCFDAALVFEKCPLCPNFLTT